MTSIDQIDWKTSRLCKSSFCQLLASFKVPSAACAGSGLVEALNEHLESNSHLHAARRRDSPCFHLGTQQDIAARHNCPFCVIVTSAIDIGSNVGEDDELHVNFIRSEGSFELTTILEPKKPERRVLTLGVRIVLCESLDHREATVQWGRPTNPKGFDSDQVRMWLSMCESGHIVQCPPGPAKFLTRLRSFENDDFRLIDVKNGSLSYVWGGIDQLQLQKRFIPSLEARGSLQKLRHRIPKTIRDAMDFVSMIGERYLWVDALCLVQDDMQNGIQLMDSVYENALATIIAADGPDAAVGLPRLHSGSFSKTQKVQIIKPNLQVMALGALEVHVKKSKWASRAWTFQEQTLSRRTIVFVNEQIYFRCRQCIWSEDTWADKFPGEKCWEEWSVSLMSPLEELSIEDDPDPLPRLTTILEHYCNRKLTYDNDAINALSGILRIISINMNSAMLQGVPVVALDYMILFNIYGHPRTGKSEKLDGAIRRKGFSSWSWAGWEASCLWYSRSDIASAFQRSFNQWLDHGTWIVWYKSYGSSAPKAILDENHLKTRLRGEEEVSYSRTSQPDLSGRFGKLDTSRTVQQALTATSKVNLKQDLLRFYTVSVTMTVSHEMPRLVPWPNYRKELRARKPSAAVYDVEGGFCGLLVLDTANFLRMDRECELILLSDSQNSIFHKIYLPDLHHSNPFVSKQDAEQEPRLFWVILLSWCEGVAERRGLGQLLQSSVEKSLPPGPQWKEIALGQL